MPGPAAVAAAGRRPRQVPTHAQPLSLLQVRRRLLRRQGQAVGRLMTSSEPRRDKSPPPPSPGNLLLPRPPRHLRTPTTSPRLFGTQADFIWPSSLFAKSLSVCISPAFPGRGLSFSPCSLQIPAICEGESEIGSRERAALELSPWLMRIN